jgi:hypothetical protein
MTIGAGQKCIVVGWRDDGKVLQVFLEKARDGMDVVAG